MPQSRPVAHWPVVLGVGRPRHGAARLAPCCPPHPAPGRAGGRGVAARLLAMLAGPQARSKVGARREERGLLPLLPPGLTRASRHEDRRGQRLETRCAAPRTRVCGALALHALAVSALAPPGLQQETTTLPRYGAYAAEARPGAGLVPPRPASGPSQEGQDERKPGLLRRGGSREGLPLRLGGREGQTRDSPATPVALAAWLAVGGEGGGGMVADSRASGQRPRGWGREPRAGLRTVGPRPWAGRQEGEAWGQPHRGWP